MKNILITGGAGFIGLNISRRLIEMGYRVFAIDNFNRAKKDREFKEIKKHKNLWNVYQKKIKQLIGINFRTANTIYVDFINNIEISHQAREILVGKIDASEIIFDKENVLNDQINSVQNKLEVEFQLGKLIALVENKMALLGIKKLDDKSGRFQTPLDFIKNISKI